MLSLPCLSSRSRSAGDSLTSTVARCAHRDSHQHGIHEIFSLTKFFLLFAIAVAPRPTVFFGMPDTAEQSAEPLFPGESPSEHDLEEWRRPFEALLRKRHLLVYAASASPEKLAEYRHKAVLTAPGGASEPLVASIAVKNMEIGDERNCVRVC